MLRFDSSFWSVTQPTEMPYSNAQSCIAIHISASHFQIHQLTSIASLQQRTSSNWRSLYIHTWNQLAFPIHCIIDHFI